MFERLKHNPLTSVEDIERIIAADDAHWAATAAPVTAFSLPSRLLAFLDADCNGRIRSDEVRHAVAWVFRVHAQPQALLEERDALNNDDFNRETAEGELLFQTAKRVRMNLGLPEDTPLTLTDISNRKSIRAISDSNGDGIIPPGATSDASLSQWIATAIATVGSVTDASGEEGINLALAQEFSAQARSALDWKRDGQASTEGEWPAHFPYGEVTPKIAAWVDRHGAKVDEYFALCRLASEAPEACDACLNALHQFKAEGENLREAIEAFLDRLPLAAPEVDLSLPSSEAIRPALRSSVEELKHWLEATTQTTHPVEAQKPASSPQAPAPGESFDLYAHLPEEFGLAHWEAIKARLAPYRAWQASRPDTSLCDMDLTQLEALLDAKFETALQALIDADAAVAEELAHLAELEKLLLYQQYLKAFLENFAVFPMLFDPERPALFQAGTLIVDGRHLSFAMDIVDRGAHKKLATQSGVMLLYLELTRGPKDALETRQVVAAVTAGNKSDLWIGKHGIFYDTKIRVWDALIVDMIENPVSLLETFKAPFIRIKQKLGDQFEQFSQTQQQKIENTVVSPTNSSAVRDLMMGASVAFAAAGSALAFMTKSFTATVTQFGWPGILKTALGIVLIIFIPMLIVGILRLRRRRLSAILEATGWALNIDLRLSHSMGKFFTRKPTSRMLPPSEER